MPQSSQIDASATPQQLGALLEEYLQKPQAALCAQLCDELQRLLPAGAEVPLPPELFAQAVAQSPVAISITDLKANILYCNQSFSEVTGYHCEELLGHNESLLSYKSTPKVLYQQMWQTLLAQRPWSGVLVNRRKDGSRYLAEVLLSPVLGADGQSSHYLGIHRDITALHQLQQRVQNQKALIESVVDAVPAVIAVLDRERQIVLDNHAYKKLAGDMRGREPAHALLEALGESDSNFSALLEGQHPFNDWTVRCVVRQGEEPRWFCCSGIWVSERDAAADSYFEERMQEYLLLVAHEITPLKRQQEALRSNAMRALLAEEALNESIRETLAAAVFKLEAPFNLLNAALHMLQRRNGETLHDASLLRLLEQVRDAGMETLQTLREAVPARADTQLRPVNINQLLHDVLLITTERLLAGGIVVDWQPAATLPPMVGSESRLRSMLKQLLDNAIEAIEAAAPRQREIHLASGEVDGWVELVIADSGDGIPAAQRHKVFEPFFTTRSGRGSGHTGMGLALVQEVVNEHAGTIEIDPDYSDGARFKLRFPCERQP